MRHFWLRDNMGNPIACVATEVKPDSTIAFAVAAFNPKDKFSRAKGVELAKVRLEKSRRSRYKIPAPESGRAKWDVMYAISHAVDLPNAVRDSAKLWMAFHDSSKPKPEATQGKTFKWKGAIVKKGQIFVPLTEVRNFLGTALVDEATRDPIFHEKLREKNKLTITTPIQSAEEIDRFLQSDEGVIFDTFDGVA